MSTTRIIGHIRAPRARVYQALLDPDEVQHWMVPDQMRSHVHAFDAREGGTFPDLADLRRANDRRQDQRADRLVPRQR